MRKTKTPKKSKWIGIHGDSNSSPKGLKSCLQGHRYNPESGAIETISASGEVVGEMQLHNPIKMKKSKYIVGTMSKLTLNYNNGPVSWNQKFVIINPKQGK